MRVWDIIEVCALGKIYPSFFYSDDLGQYVTVRRCGSMGRIYKLARSTILASLLRKYLARASSRFVMPIGKDSLPTYCLYITVVAACNTWTPFVDAEGHTLLRLLAEVTVLGVILLSVLLRRVTVSFLRRMMRLGWVNRYLLSALVAGSFIAYASLIVSLGEPGGWWWIDGNADGLFGGESFDEGAEAPDAGDWEEDAPQ